MPYSYTINSDRLNKILSDAGKRTRIAADKDPVLIPHAQDFWLPCFQMRTETGRPIIVLCWRPGWANDSDLNLRAVLRVRDPNAARIGWLSDGTAKTNTEQMLHYYDWESPVVGTVYPAPVK